ncbi:tyrosine-type recombinase/integrase [Paraburkholderia oxyphila]|uniref:tyrosine-type recombinase/integrase n=1 Tax=Paraburkholderia oxyphila TaxID=614212 RepID=UPI0004808DDD|nr:tyrosine-type recombinase/integrase [Paraburkholderia oxyphila]
MTSTLLRPADDESLQLEQVERALLREVAPHALRHAWATAAVSCKMPLDVVQLLLGHALLSTSVIYTHAERIRSIEEVARFFGDAS